MDDDHELVDPSLGRVLGLCRELPAPASARKPRAVRARRLCGGPVAQGSSQGWWSPSVGDVRMLLR